MNDPAATPPPYGDGPPQAPQGPPTGAPQAPGQWGTPPPAPPAPGQWGTPPPSTPPPPGQHTFDPHLYGQTPALPYVPGGGTRWDDRVESRIAEPGIRIGAKVLDTIFIVILQFIVGFVAALMFVSSGSSGFGSDTGLVFGQNLALTLTVAIVGLVIDVVYNVVLVAAFGGQPGKLLLGLRIVTTDGAKADAGVAFRRWTPMLVILALSAIPVVSILGSLARLVLVVANLVMIFADDRRRDVFDHVGGTYVIATR